MKQVRIKIISLVVASLLFSIGPATWAQGEVKGATIELKALCNACDGGTLAYQLARTFLSEDEFKKEVTKIQSKINDWQKDNEGDAGRYLNDRLVIVALSAAGGEIPKIQRGITWLAFYHALNEPAPSFVSKFLREHRGSVMRLLDGFSWNKASDYVKKKRWREDIEERKRKKAEGESKAATNEKKDIQAPNVETDLPKQSSNLRLSCNERTQVACLPDQFPPVPGEFPLTAP